MKIIMREPDGTETTEDVGPLASGMIARLRDQAARADQSWGEAVIIGGIGWLVVFCFVIIHIVATP